MDANINELLKKLFSDLSYEYFDYSFVDNEDGLLDKSFFAKDVFKKNYYLILFLSDDTKIEEVIKNQSKYFFLLKEFFGEDSEIDKNTSLVICLQSKNIINRSILNVEEDPYYFKKYVLKYTEHELTEFINQYSEDIKEKGIKQVLEEIIKDVQQFEDFKKNPDIKSVYNFISKIFIKIPVLKVPFDEEKVVNSLSDVIESSLREKNLYNLKIKLDELKGEFEVNETFLESIVEIYKK